MSLHVHFVYSKCPKKQRKDGADDAMSDVSSVSAGTVVTDDDASDGSDWSSASSRRRSQRLAAQQAAAPERQSDDTSQMSDIKGPVPRGSKQQQQQQQCTDCGVVFLRRHRYRLGISYYYLSQLAVFSERNPIRIKNISIGNISIDT
jgi:hypothetical protein